MAGCNQEAGRECDRRKVSSAKTTTRARSVVLDQHSELRWSSSGRSAADDPPQRVPEGERCYRNDGGSNARIECSPLHAVQPGHAPDDTEIGTRETHR